jgi:hypothetical protein
MDANQNIQLIRNMMEESRSQVRDNGVFFLLWGWLVFAAAAIQLVMIQMGYPEQSGWPWAVLMPAGGIASIFLIKKEKDKSVVKTWFDNVMRYLWLAFGVVLGITLFTMFKKQINLMPIVIALYGLGLFITGGLLQFRPLIIGGIVSWLISIVGIYFFDYYTAIWLVAIAILAGYIIPGHMLRSKFKRDVQGA